MSCTLRGECTRSASVISHVRAVTLRKSTRERESERGFPTHRTVVIKPKRIRAHAIRNVVSRRYRGRGVPCVRRAARFDWLRPFRRRPVTARAFKPR